MFDSFVFLPLSTRAYFKGRAYIKIILKNHARSYFAGRSYYRGNTVTKHNPYFSLQQDILKKTFFFKQEKAKTVEGKKNSYHKLHN